VNHSRRRSIQHCLSFVALVATSLAARGQPRQSTDHVPDNRWYEAAASMRRLAQSWGDQPYGAVLVAADALVGEGPSRVVQKGDSAAHAEREAIQDAQRRLGRKSLEGSILYSTSRPCSVCEAVAAEAGVARMYYGPEMRDAGEPGK
jgi:tRNA(adenine34) deaminase